MKSQETALAGLELLQAVRHDDIDRALALLTRHPGLESVSIRTACAAGDLAAVRAFLARDAALATQTIPPDHTWPLIYACFAEFKRCRGVSDQDQAEIVRALLDAGADANASIRVGDGEGTIPALYFPSRAGNVAVARVLLAYGARPTDGESLYRDGQAEWQIGETPLHRAAANGYGVEILARFMACGADVNAARRDGTTPYTLAVRSGNAAAAVWLAGSGADRSRLTPTDRLLGACLTTDTDRAQAIVSEHPDIVASLSEVDAGALLQAIVDDKQDAVRLMLALGWPLTSQSQWGGTALHWAAWHAQRTLVQTLIEHGAPVNVRDTRYGSSPIGWAAHGSQYSDKGSDDDYVAIVEMLLDAGATRDEAINRWQESPESMARPAVVAALHARGFVGAER
ncbi:MAG: hypothetical protein EBV77_09720 [Gemmatimonadaceae bacterium]|nr:hypothetical protein [Gemmatimonadaceae bacterium]